MPTITLTRLTGFDRNKKLTLDKDTVTLGTDAACDLRFDPTWDKTVSAAHLTLEFKQGTWWFKDSSKEGTYISGSKVSQNKLAPGSVIELGRAGPKIQIDFSLVTSQVSANTSTSSSTGVDSAPPRVPPPPPLAAVPVRSPTPAQHGKPGWLVPAILAAAAVAVAVIVYVCFYKGDSGNPFSMTATPEQALAEAAKKYANAVALVVLVNSSEGVRSQEPIATAWAVAPRVFATNSHVSTPIYEALKKGQSAYLVINKQPEKKLRIVKAVIHPKYQKAGVNFEGKEAAAGSYDVGLLYTDEDAPNFFPLAKRSELEKLDSGYRIAFLGFPTEGMMGGGVEVHNPVATMQSGIITSMTDYWLGKATFEKRLLLQHNLGAAGGASGSPIFNSEGRVVAVLNAGNVIGSVSKDGDITRAPSAVMVNFGQRVDLLRDIWLDYPKD